MHRSRVRGSVPREGSVASIASWATCVEMGVNPRFVGEKPTAEMVDNLLIYCSECQDRALVPTAPDPHSLEYGE